MDNHISLSKLKEIIGGLYLEKVLNEENLSNMVNRLQKEKEDLMLAKKSENEVEL